MSRAFLQVGSKVGYRQISMVVRGNPVYVISQGWQVVGFKDTPRGEYVLISKPSEPICAAKRDEIVFH